jgi:hypothetical protein
MRAFYVALYFIVSIIIYHSIFSIFYPNYTGTLGADFSYEFPRYLAGYFWQQQNGLFSIPWFSPHSCGGVPFFVHPNSTYFSLAQYLALFFSPLNAYYITYIVFAFLGLSGFYVLLRKSFDCTVPLSLLGGVLFLFNGYYAYHSIAGGFPLHSFMIIPWIVLCLTMPRERRERLREGFLIVLVGLFFSYIIYSGGMSIIVPVSVAVFIMGCIRQLFIEENLQFWWRLVLGYMLFLIVAGMKISLAVKLLSVLPRSSYNSTLPGYESFYDALVIPFKILFFGPEVPRIALSISPSPSIFWECSISFVPLILLLFGAFKLLHDYSKGKLKGCINKSVFSKVCILLIGVFFLIQVPLMYYTPDWNRFLHQLPIISSCSELFRWYCANIPVVILISILLFSRIRLNVRIEVLLLIVLSLTVYFLNYKRNKDPYHYGLLYDGGMIEAKYDEVKKTGKIPEITEIVAFSRNDQENIYYRPLGVDSMMVNGFSYVMGYEPVFGYNSELLKFNPLKHGSVFEVENGFYNMKNPASYIFPDENNARPGDHFKVDEREELEQFVRYRAFKFNMPLYQRFLNYFSLTAFLLSLCYVMVYLFCCSMNYIKNRLKY